MAKAQDVAKLFIDLATQEAARDEGDEMTDLRLQKLLYFAQGWHIARYGKPLFDDEIEAWKYGPVVPSVYRSYRKFGKNPLHDAPPSSDAFTPEEYDFLMDVIREYWKYSGSELVSKSHAEGTPWKKVYRDDKMHTPITKEAMRAYFSTLEPLPGIRDILAVAMSRREVIMAQRGKNGEAILPKEIIDDWGVWDD